MPISGTVPAKPLRTTLRNRYTSTKDRQYTHYVALVFGILPVVVVVLTLTRIIKSVVTGQPPVTPEWENTPGKTNTQTKVVASSPASRIAWTRATGSACPSEYSPVLQTPEDRTPQGIPGQRTRHGVDPPSTSALPSNFHANPDVQVSAALSDLTPPPTTPNGVITNNRRPPLPATPSDT